MLAIAVPLGYLAVRDQLAPQAPSRAWLAGELAIYTCFAITALFLVLGGILGRQDDRLAAGVTTDALTGLPDRRYMFARVGEELARSAHFGTRLAMLLIGIDRLKSINDQYSHEAGDATLRRVADSLRLSCLGSQLPARHVGDQFMVLLVPRVEREAMALADQIRATLQTLSQQNPSLPPVTVSIGVAEADGATTSRPEALYEAADRALYAAKASGGDRSMHASDLSLRIRVPGASPEPTQSTIS